MILWKRHFKANYGANETDESFLYDNSSFMFMSQLFSSMNGLNK